MCHLPRPNPTIDQRLGTISGRMSRDGADSFEALLTLQVFREPRFAKYVVIGPPHNILWSPSLRILKIVFLALSGAL